VCEPGCREAIAVCGDSLGYEDILERRTLATDLEFAVFIAPLVLMVKVDKQLLHVRVTVNNFFREDQPLAIAVSRISPRQTSTGVRGAFIVSSSAMMLLQRSIIATELSMARIRQLEARMPWRIASVAAPSEQPRS
jgi:hypothetical protein